MTLEEKITAAQAVIFASGDGISTESLKEILEVDDRQLTFIFDSIKDRFNGPSSGIVLNTNSEWASFTCSPRMDEIVYRALSIKKNTPLSNAAMETLAIIAYNQPVSRSFIERVRGVDSSSSIQTLITRGLAEEKGRLDIPGHPISYGTTPLFLRSFSLESLEDLPSVKPEDNGGQMSVFDSEESEEKEEE